MEKTGSEENKEKNRAKPKGKSGEVVEKKVSMFARAQNERKEKGEVKEERKLCEQKIEGEERHIKKKDGVTWGNEKAMKQSEAVVPSKKLQKRVVLTNSSQEENFPFQKFVLQVYKLLDEDEFF